MALITKATVTINGQQIKPLKQVELDEIPVNEVVTGLNEYIGRLEKTQVPGFKLSYIKDSAFTEPTWADYNDKVATIQELNGDRYKYSGLILIQVGSFVLDAESEQVKVIEFKATSRTKT